MDIETLGAAIAVAKSIPGTAAERAETAAESAESAAEIAEASAYGITITGTTLNVTEGSEE